MKNIKIETANGTYVVKNPVGRIGALHFSILQSCAPSGGKDGLTPADAEKLAEGFNKWASRVLGSILVEDESSFKYDEMPGEDQYAIFIALMSNTNISDDLFRIVQ